MLKNTLLSAFVLGLLTCGGGCGCFHNWLHTGHLHGAACASCGNAACSGAYDGACGGPGLQCGRPLGWRILRLFGWGNWGCGHAYYGDFPGPGARCEPCDHFGNYMPRGYIGGSMTPAHGEVIYQGPVQMGEGELVPPPAAAAPPAGAPNAAPTPPPALQTR